MPSETETACRRCTGCEGMDHHWMPESDDEINDGEPFMACKHCPATREMTQQRVLYAVYHGGSIESTS